MRKRAQGTNTLPFACKCSLTLTEQRHQVAHGVTVAFGVGF